MNVTHLKLYSITDFEDTPCTSFTPLFLKIAQKHHLQPAHPLTDKMTPSLKIFLPRYPAALSYSSGLNLSNILLYALTLVSIFFALNQIKLLHRWAL